MSFIPNKIWGAVNSAVPLGMNSAHNWPLAQLIALEPRVRVGTDHGITLVIPVLGKTLPHLRLTRVTHTRDSTNPNTRYPLFHSGSGALVATAPSTALASTASSA